MTELAVNARARFDHDILETFEAGIVLSGHEVKSLVLGRVSLGGSYAVARGGELWILNMDVAPYQAGNTPAHYDQKRPRKLLLHRREIATLIGSLQEKKLTLVPLAVYTKNGKCKVHLGLARSKKQGDKRAGIKRRETEREMRRAVASH